MKIKKADQAKMKIKKGDTVKVIAGKAKGKTGKVLRVDPAKQRIIVERLNMMKHHKRPSQKNPQGTFEREAPIPISNVMFYCSRCNDAVRVGVKRTEGGRLRICKDCGGEFD
jgi:large subunit ribosomal protein L24